MKYKFEQAAKKRLWVVICPAIAVMIVALYGLDISSETIARNIFLFRMAFLFGTLTTVVLCPLLFHLRFHKLKLSAERDRLVAKIQADSANGKTLRDLLPICSYCKKTRNGEGYWERIETYVTNNLRLDLTHGICPECMAKIEEDIRSLDVVLPAGKRDIGRLTSARVESELANTNLVVQKGSRGTYF
jgi:hypothetical protein